ncbi:Fc.00g047030.m01.CDS01 [Cosmosporella sp. VM-42]
MSSSAGGAGLSPNTALEEPADERDSINVNPGSPPSPLPPLNDQQKEEERIKDQPQSVQRITREDEKAVTTGLKSDGTEETVKDQPQENEKPSEDIESESGTDLKPVETHEQPPHTKESRFIIDPSGEQTFDQTTVDIVTVPCPGGHPLKTWNRDGLMSRYFGAPSMRDAEVKESESERPTPSWVRQGIRREADRARILLYEHPEATEGTTLSNLADSLLEELHLLRRREGRDRPLVFIGHSVGGIVVKMMLVKAGRNKRFVGILQQCYGVAFFGTPHQGSSFFSMPSLALSIQTLLQLSAPLPCSITKELCVGNSLLLHLDDDFKTIAMDFRVWTFYETIDSRLSGNGSGDVYFTAPLTSIKSAILGMRQESIFPLQSDHANIASFGRHNVHSLRLFLRQLAFQISRADEYSLEDGNWTWNLEQKVNIEVHGFFEDPVGPESADTTIRAWSTRLPLKDFLRKGPEECLTERLNEVDGVPEDNRFLRTRGRTSFISGDERRKPTAVAATKNALGIQQDDVVSVSPPASPIIRPVDIEPRFRRESAPQGIPSTPLTPPSRGTSPPTRYSTPGPRPSPLIRASFDQDLAVDRLSPPPRGRMGRSFSRSYSLGSSHYEYRDFPPFSQRSRSTMEGNFSDDDGLENSPQLPEAVIAIRKTVKDAKRMTSETVIVDEAPVAFVKPEVHARKFVWIHLPYNNPTWVTKVFETLQVSYNRNYSPLFNQDFWAMRHTRGRHSQHYAYFAKPGCYFTAPRPMSPRGSSKHASLSPSPAGGIYTCLFLPYLHFDSYKRLLRRRELILQRLQHGRARPIPENVAKTDSLELQVIWEYLGHDPPLNSRRTLDQYGYPSLRDTRSRDDDQMLYKLTKERPSLPGEKTGLRREWSSSGAGMDGSSRSHRSQGSQSSDEEEEEEGVLNGNVLMVDQLWLWAIDSHTLLSFFPKREGDAIEGPLYQQADLRDSIFNEVNVDLTHQCENALDLAALAALHAVTVLLDRSSHPDLEVFRIFEEAISVLTEKLTSSLKTFRAEGFRDKAFLDPVENKARSIRARHKAEGRRAEEENRDNTSALLELRDIEDELLILLHLFERQSKVISSMHGIYTRPEMRDRTANGRFFLNEALKKLGEYTHQAQEMIQRVRNTRNDYDKLLQMVQRQAQVDEVRLSRLHTDLASAQSRSVMILTTFSVLFLPLTFFTGLFGMNTREWGGANNLPLKTIGLVSLPTSLLLILCSLIIAWSTTVRRFFRWIGKLYGWSMRRMDEEIWEPMAKSVKRRMTKARKGVRAESGEGRRGLAEEMSDFWERHRLERERGYQVPENNRRSIVGGKGSSKGKGSRDGKVRFEK